MPEKIILFGPPASGKSTTINAAARLVPGAIAFDLELVTVRHEEEPSRQLQQSLFEAIKDAHFPGHFFLGSSWLSLPWVRVNAPSWKNVILLPRDLEAYMSAVKARAKERGQDDDQQDYRGSHRHFSGLAYQYRDDPSVITVDRLNAAGPPRPTEETIAEIVQRLCLGPH